jgi:hypothetical protein
MARMLGAALSGMGTSCTVRATTQVSVQVKHSITHACHNKDQTSPAPFKKHTSSPTCPTPPHPTPPYPAPPSLHPPHPTPPHPTPPHPTPPHPTSLSTHPPPTPPHPTPPHPAPTHSPAPAPACRPPAAHPAQSVGPPPADAAPGVEQQQGRGDGGQDASIPVDRASTWGGGPVLARSNQLPSGIKHESVLLCKCHASRWHSRLQTWSTGARTRQS